MPSTVVLAVLIVVFSLVGLLAFTSPVLMRVAGLRNLAGGLTGTLRRRDISAPHWGADVLVFLALGELSLLVFTDHNLRAEALPFGLAVVLSALAVFFLGTAVSRRLHRISRRNGPGVMALYGLAVLSGAALTLYLLV